jgi:hypothetical protein
MRRISGCCSRWPAGGAVPRPGQWFTPTAEPNTRHGCSGTGSAKPGCSGQWVASSVDNALIESFRSTMQRELLDRSSWTSRRELATAIFEWIEGFYNPTRRHIALGNLSPVEFERLHTTAAIAA